MQARYSSQALQATSADRPLALQAGNVWYYKQDIHRSQCASLLTLNAGLRVVMDLHAEFVVNDSGTAEC